MIWEIEFLLQSNARAGKGASVLSIIYFSARRPTSFIRIRSGS